jgi:hypothetical protein
MGAKLYELVKEEKGILVPDYEFRGWDEFGEKIEKPIIQFMGFEKRRGENMEKILIDFVTNKSLDYFENYLKRAINFMETNSLTELNWKKPQIKENIEKSNLECSFPSEAIKLVNYIRRIPMNKYVLLNIDKINLDLIEIYQRVERLKK